MICNTFKFHYLQTDSPLYYYSFSDAFIARPTSRCRPNSKRALIL